MISDPLISAADALALQNDSDVRFIDATWYMPNVPSNAYETYLLEHIPGAVYFDIDKIADTSINLPHVFPTQEIFEEAVGTLGISAQDRVIAYDRGNFVASARAWWMFRAFGHEQFNVLDGGLRAWKNAGGDLAEGTHEIEKATYQSQTLVNAIISREGVVNSMSNSSVAVVDARSPGRFNGTEPEPRPGLPGGHIPGSANMYYGDVLNEDGTMKGPDVIAELLSSLSINNDQQIVSTCGSGVTAAIILLAIYQVRQDGLRMYDGSWTEWALNPDSPMSN